MNGVVVATTCMRNNTSPMQYKIGIDVGGTFTDFLLLNKNGGTEVYKVLSTSEDPSIAVLDGLTRMAKDRELSLEKFLSLVDIIVHGTTVTTNAVLTGNTAKTGLLTTRGFRDALEMRRGIREETYDNKAKPAEPLVPRWLRRPVSERVTAEGLVQTDIDLSDIDDALRHFRVEGVEAIAICFMHSYANQINEEKAETYITDLMPDVYLSSSCDILRQVRFYDRLSTTVLNTSVGPILKKYLENLTKRLAAAQYENVLLIMQSNGGVTAPQTAMRLAATTLLSGPAAAPVAGLAYTAQYGENSFITVDMGGTSLDAALVRNGVPHMTTQAKIAKHALALPTLDINTIGAGGGSVGWIDDGGLLRMGPQSAGAQPGPACYRLGGSKPTCTDANLVLGYLSSEFFAGGEIKLDKEAAARAIKEYIAEPLGISLIQAAVGMYRLMNVNMASGIREITVQRGFDPRDIPLVCAGGAGPVHAAMIAEELDMTRIIIPRESSIFCAAGMLWSDFKHDYVRSYHTEWSLEKLDPDRMRQALDDMRRQADETLLCEGISPQNRRYDYSLDLRYLGQYHEVAVRVEENQLRGPAFEAISKALHHTHNALYGYDLESDGTEIELVNLRLAATGTTVKPPMASEDFGGTDPSAALKGKRPVFLIMEDEFADVSVYDGDQLVHGNQIFGPAVVEQVNTTIIVPTGYRLVCDALGSFELTAGA